MNVMVKQYEHKMQNILNMYPKTKIFVSLVMPTKDRMLKNCINEFNQCLYNIIESKYSSVNILSHNDLVDQLGLYT